MITPIIDELVETLREHEAQRLRSVEKLFTQSPEQKRLREEMNERWDRELAELIAKSPIPAGPPEIPPGITFPFLMVYHRKKVSNRNNNYLMAAVIENIGDLTIISRNLAHKGWPNKTLMFDIPEFMLGWVTNRYMYWRYNNWDEIAPDLSDSDRMLIPELKKLFPCPTTQVVDKKGQYKLIF
jgi:hypothetical protein